jgi:hypothetical protein
MKAELTALSKKPPMEGSGYLPEFPGANGQGETVEESEESLGGGRFDCRGPARRFGAGYPRTYQETMLLMKRKELEKPIKNQEAI